MVEQEVRKETEKERTSEPGLGDVDTDDDNDEEEYEAWKVRELKRIKRDREERETYVLYSYVVLRFVWSFLGPITQHIFIHAHYLH